MPSLLKFEPTSEPRPGGFFPQTDALAQAFIRERHRGGGAAGGKCHDEGVAGFSQQHTGPDPRAEADPEQVVARLQGECAEDGDDECAEGFERPKALRADDAGDDAEDGERDEIDDPVQDDDERVEGDLHDVAEILHGPVAHLRKAMPKPMAMKMTPMTLP